MALVLPILRLWLLVLNIYGTFKAMKPSPQSQRSVRNKSGPSARAMQLRKRELKSCLAVWVVWSIFSTAENVLDRTIGLVIPFYNELKCLVFLFLLVARAHGAEAIFLHFIHPLLRPYVPAIDDILANLQSVFDLLILLFFLPLEYVSSWWHRWSWGQRTQVDGSEPPSDHDVGGGGEVLLEGRRVLRPRSASQQSRLIEADRQARAVFHDIDDAQDRVRTRTRNQPAAPAVRNGGRILAAREGGDVASGSNAVGLRTRKRVLEYPSADGQPHGPGSRTTRVHHVGPIAMDDLPPVPSLQPFPVLPTAPTTQPVALLSNPLPLPPRPSANSSSYEIWHPPRSTSGGSADQPRKTPSPLYPPLPSAYVFTPRASEPLPPPPRIITPPNLVSPTPRRISTGTAHGGADHLPGRTSRARPSRDVRSAEPPRSMEQGNMQAQDFFGRALEPSIQAAEMDMETLSTKDSSSANEEDVESEEGNHGANMARTTSGVTLGGVRKVRNQRRAGPEDRKGKRKTVARSDPLRRSTRKKPRRSPSVDTDEFGFTIRTSLSSLGSLAAASSTATSSSVELTAPSGKKFLARTKPALKAVQGGDETASSEEESGRKRQRLNSAGDAAPGESAFEAHGANDNPHESELRSPPKRRGPRGARGKIKKGAQGTTDAQARTLKQTEVHSGRATRTSGKQQPISAKENQLGSTGATKRMRGR